VKTSIYVLAIIGLFITGCSTTTYFNLNETYPEYIDKELNKVEKDSGVGVEMSLLLKNGNEVNGELLSVRDSTIFLCPEYSATEEELAKLKYPILLFSNNEIQQLAIEGNSWVWEGIGAGALVGGLTGLLIASASSEGGGREEGLAVLAGMIIGAWVGIAAGWITGYALSTEEYVMWEIPPDYSWSILKPLARYPDEEPEYLRSIK
jgi:outer membrane lipoprotein SlyB